MCGNLLFVNTVLCLCLIAVAGCAIVSNRVQTRVRKGQQRLIDAYRRELDAQHTLIVSLRDLLTEKQLLIDEQVKQLKMYRAPPFHGEPVKCGMTGFFGHREADNSFFPEDDGVALDSVAHPVGGTINECAEPSLLATEEYQTGRAPDGGIVLFDDSATDADEELARIQALGWRDREHLAEARRNGWECNDPGCKACETRCDQLAARNQEPK